MILKRIKVLTELKEYTNTYIIQDEVTKETMVVDPGGEVDKIVQMLDILGARLKYIYLTHCHGDHIGGVCELKNKKGGIILIHRFDAEGLENDKLSLTTYIGIDAKFESDSRLNDNDLIHLGNLNLKLFIHQDIQKEEVLYIAKVKDLLLLVIHYLEEHGEEQIYHLET